MQIIEFTDRDPISLIFDEDEETTIPFYKLYKRIKREWPLAKRKCAAISFADDKQLFGLQAADLVASVMRLQIDYELNRTPYDYSALHDAIAIAPDRSEKLWFAGIAIGDKKNLQSMSVALKKEWQRLKKQ